MNLAIIATDENDESAKSKSLSRINGEYIIERIIRLAKNNGVKKIFCIISPAQRDLKNILLSSGFSADLELLVMDTISSMHSLFELVPYLKNAPFILTASDSVFSEEDFVEFINYSSLQESVDGVVSISHYMNDERPFCVSMNEDDTILRFSDSKEGYSWATGGVGYFSPSILHEVVFSLNIGIYNLRDFFRVLVEKGYLLKGFSFSEMTDVQRLIKK